MKRQGWTSDGYYFDKNGNAKTNCCIDNKYYLDEKGKKITNQYKLINGKKCYLDNNGLCANDWIKIDNAWYYFKDGISKTGWEKIDNNYYFFNSSGVMQTGWKAYKNKWYYLDENGIMLCNTQRNIDGKNYQFDGDGVATEVKQTQNKHSGNTSNDGGEIFKYATNARLLNNYINQCIDYSKKMAHTNNYFDSYNYVIQIKSCAEILMSQLEVSYQIDAMSGNKKGVEEEKLGYRMAKGFIELAENHGAY